MNGFHVLINQCRREYLLQVREPRALFFSGLFFAMIAIFFPLTIVPDPLFLRQMAPGVLWTALLLTLLMASERLFQDDEQEGVLEQWLVSGLPVSILVFAKIMVHCFLNLIPIVLLCPLIGALFDLSWFARGVLMISIVLATPVMLLICALSAAFCTRMPQKGILMALVLMPLVVPVMIFGSAALNAAIQQLPVSGYLAILLAMLLLAMFMLPFAIAGVLRASLGS